MINKNEVETEVETMKDMISRINIELNKEYFCTYYIREKLTIFNQSLKQVEDKLPDPK